MMPVYNIDTITQFFINRYVSILFKITDNPISESHLRSLFPLVPHIVSSWEQIMLDFYKQEYSMNDKNLLKSFIRKSYFPQPRFTKRNIWECPTQILIIYDQELKKFFYAGVFLAETKFRKIFLDFKIL